MSDPRTRSRTVRTVMEVKCYHCGHVSGQIHGSREHPPRVSDFVPRPGYTGPAVKPGTRLRCERCGGPVFLEDVTLGQSPLPLPRVRRPAA